MSRQGETSVVNAVLEALGRSPDCRIWRQRAGLFWTRQINGAPVQAVPDSCADLSGLLRDGRRLEIECKVPRTGRQSDGQKAWQAMIERFGGVYLIARSAEDAVRGVKLALEGRETKT